MFGLSFNRWATNPLRSLVLNDAGTVISCAADPCDLRPAINGIMAQIELVSLSLRKNQPLIVIVGEDHTSSIPHLLRLMLLDCLKNKNNGDSDRSVMFSIERPRNTLGDYIKVFVPNELKEEMSNNDIEGQNALAAILAGHPPPYAPVSMLTQYYHCYKNGISSHFTDLARIEDYSKDINHPNVWIDQSDLATRDIVARHTPRLLGQNIDAQGQQGVRLRNLAMVERTMLAQSKTKTPLVLMQAGFAHLFGMKKRPDNGEPLDYHYSLCSLFKKAGAAILQIVTTYDDKLETIPNAARRAFSSSIIVTDTARNRYTQPQHPMMNFSFFHPELDVGEVDFIKIVAEKSKHKFEIFDPSDPTNKARKDISAWVKARTPRWIENASNKKPLNHTL